VTKANDDFENLDLSPVRELYRSMPIAKAVFKTLAERDRPRMTTDLRRLRLEMVNDGYPIDKSEFMKLFEELQDMGLGSLINPRRENDTHRFKWRYNLLHVAKAATSKGKTQPLQRAIAPAPPPIERQAARPARTMAIPFRQGLLELPVPEGLSKDEAEYIADIYRRAGQ
jgi:hypothetical protein